MEKAQTPGKDIEDVEKLLVAGNKAEESVMVAYRNWLPNRKEAIKRLTSLAEDLDKYHAKANKRSLGGSIVSAIGGSAFIAGLLLAPATGGLSSILTAGAAAGTFGSATSIVSSVSEMSETKSACSNVQKIIDNDKKYTDELVAKLEKFETLIKKIHSAIQNTPFTGEELIKLAERSSILCKKTAIGIIVLNTIGSLILKLSDEKIVKLLKMMDIKAPSASMRSLVPRFRNAVVRKGKHACRYPAQLSKAARFGLGVTAGVSIALDIWTIINVIEDMDKGSISETGKKFREIAEGLEKEQESLENVISQYTKKICPSLGQ